MWSISISVQYLHRNIVSMHIITLVMICIEIKLRCRFRTEILLVPCTLWQREKYTLLQVRRQDRGKSLANSTGVDLTGLQVGDPVIVDARGYLSFFVFFLFLEFKDEFRHDFFNTISSWYDKFIYVFKNHLDGTVFFFKDDFNLTHARGCRQHGTGLQIQPPEVKTGLPLNK